MTTERLAFDVLAKLQHRLGHVPVIEQVDAVPCEGCSDVMLYVYYGGGHCEPVTLERHERPQSFDPAALEAAMIGGGSAVH
jgi:hypothetical protein